MKKTGTFYSNFYRSLLFTAFTCLLAQTGIAQSYCSANGTQPWQQWVERIELNTLDNSSSKCHLGVCGYSDFTNESTTLDKQTNYTITLSAGLSWPDPNANLYWKVWVDLNQDGDFDDTGENVVTTNGNAAVQTANINLPTSATNGSTRMRIALQKGQFAATCGTFTLGEVEDYTVDIQGGGGGGGACADITCSPSIINDFASGGTFTITVDNPGGVTLNADATDNLTGNSLLWATATVINNTTVQLVIDPNTGANPVSRSGSVFISCYDGTPNTIYSDFYQTTPAGTCWTNEEAGYGLLASEIQYDPNNSSVTETFSNNTPSPYTFSEMIGVNQRSQAMNDVYLGNQVLLDDSFISELSSHVRAFHHHEKDYPSGLAPNQSPPTEIGGQYTGSINKLYKVWKENWANRSLDVEIIATLTNAAPIGNNGNFFPGKWWSTEQWGANQTERYNNAKTFGKAFAETACPDPGNFPCSVDMLEVGNEAWGYEDPETYKQVYRGVVDGVKEYFVNEEGYADDIEQWPMGIMPGAFQSFRAEGIIGTLSGGPVYDQLGRRLPCDYGDYIQGISVHPYGFVNENRYWMYDIGFGLNQEPENPRSLFQFVKNAVYWRNVNLPTKESGNSDKYKAKMYVSEFGYGSEDYLPYPGAPVFPGVGELTQGIYNLRSILMMSRLGIYHTSIYDSWDHDDGAYYGYGLYTDGGGSVGNGPLNPKPHYNVLKNFKDELGDSRYLQAIHDGDDVNGTNLYAYVMGDAAGTPTHLVVWNGIGMSYAVGTSDVNNQRTTLTANGGSSNVSFSLNSISGVTVNASQSKWLHDDLSNINYSGTITVNGSNDINLNISAIPVLIPLNGGPCGTCSDGIQNCDEEGIDCGGSCPNTCSSDLNFSIVATPSSIDPTTVFNTTMTLTNNTGQIVSNVSIDASDLNYSNSSNSATAFQLNNYNITVSHGNYNYWTALWDGFSLADGETATVSMQLEIRTNNECVSNISMNATGTSSYGNVSASETVNCGSGGSSCTNGIQDGDETGVDCGGSCPNSCSSNSLELSLIANPNTISSTTVFDLTIMLENNTSSTVSNIIVDGSNLNYNNSSTTNPAFSLSNYNIATSHGNYNYWTAIWDGFSLAAGETATVVMQLELSQGSGGQCVPDIPMSATSTSSFGSLSASENVDCVTTFGGGTTGNNSQRVGGYLEAIQLFPNPVMHELTVTMLSKENLNLQISIMNTQGQKLIEAAAAVHNGTNEVLIDTKDLPAGIYYLHIDGITGDEEALKFIKVSD